MTQHQINAPAWMEGPGGSSTRPWAAVVLLALVGILNYIDRYLPAVLAPLIKDDLHLSDTAIGLINGFGFLVIYAVFGIPLARMADRGGYHFVISGCLAVWSFMTMLGGLAQTGWQLALTRMGVAVGEAGTTPAAHAFISRNFAPDERAVPIALLTMSVPAANLIGLMGGGLLGQTLGWRMTFLVMGLLSLAIAPIVFLVLRRHNHLTVAEINRVHHSTGIRRLLSKRSYLLIVLGCALITVGGYSMTTFGPLFLVRRHGMSLGQVGVQYALAAGIVSLVGLVVSGVLADRLSARDPRWLLWVIALFMAALMPVAAAAFLVENAKLAVALLAISNIGLSVFMAPAVAAMQRIAPPELRATASAVMLFVAALFGGVGPLITGLVSDAFQPRVGALALGYGLMVVPVAYAISGLFFLAASRSFLKDIVPEAASAGSPPASTTARR